MTQKTNKTLNNSMKWNAMNSKLNRNDRQYIITNHNRNIVKLPTSKLTTLSIEYSSHFFFSFVKWYGKTDLIQMTVVGI